MLQWEQAIRLKSLTSIFVKSGLLLTFPIKKVSKSVLFYTNFREICFFTTQVSHRLVYTQLSKPYYFSRKWNLKILVNKFCWTLIALQNLLNRNKA